MQALTILNTVIHRRDSLYSLNDLHVASGGNPTHRPGEFMRLQQTTDLIAEIENAGIPAFKSAKGRNGGTYACRELVIAYAAWISAAFHLKVIRVFLDATMPAKQLPKPAPKRNVIRGQVVAAQMRLLVASGNVQVKIDVPVSQLPFAPGDNIEMLYGVGTVPLATQPVKISITH